MESVYWSGGEARTSAWLGKMPLRWRRNYTRTLFVLLFPTVNWLWLNFLPRCLKLLAFIARFAVTFLLHAVARFAITFLYPECHSSVLSFSCVSGSRFFFTWMWLNTAYSGGDGGAAGWSRLWRAPRLPSTMLFVGSDRRTGNSRDDSALQGQDLW